MTQAKREAKAERCERMSKRKEEMEGKGGGRSLRVKMLACVCAVQMCCRAAAAIRSGRAASVLRAAERVWTAAPYSPVKRGDGAARKLSFQFLQLRPRDQRTARSRCAVCA